VSVRQIVSGVVAQFREELTNLVESSLGEPMTPEGFVELVSGLKSTLAATGRLAFVELVMAQEEHGDFVEHAQRRHRFKQSSHKEWLTPFGLVRIDRRYFQPDDGGDGVAAIDLRCGMVDRYMTPDLEEATALASADLSPSATRELFGKVLVRAPSEKAIRWVVADMGRWAEDAWDDVEHRVAEEAPLPEGDTLVVSVAARGIRATRSSAKRSHPRVVLRRA